MEFIPYKHLVINVEHINKLNEIKVKCHREKALLIFIIASIFRWSL